MSTVVTVPVAVGREEDNSQISKYRNRNERASGNCSLEYRTETCWSTAGQPRRVTLKPERGRESGERARPRGNSRDKGPQVGTLVGKGRGGKEGKD